MKPVLRCVSLAVLSVVMMGSVAAQSPASAPAAAPTFSASALVPEIQQAAVAQGVYELVFSPRLQAVFVAASGGWGDTAETPRLLRLNPKTLAVEASYPQERKGFGLALDDAAGRLYVGNTIDGSISVLDAATGELAGRVQLVEKVKATAPDGKVTESYPFKFREIVLDLPKRRLYTLGLDTANSTLFVVNLDTLQVEKTVPDLGFWATGIALDEAAGRLYASNFEGQLFAIDTTTLTAQPAVRIEGDQLINLHLDTKRQRLLATDQGLATIDGARAKVEGMADYARHGDGGKVVVIDPNHGATLQQVPTGAGALAMRLDAARNLLYVSNRAAGTVTVHDADTYREIQSIALPGLPNSLALDEATGTLFVTLKNGPQAAKGSQESVVRIGW